MSRLRPWWQRITEQAESASGAMILAIVAIAVFAVEAVAWPVQRGRDEWDYLVYYLSFLDGSTPFPLVMLVRSPVSALVLGVPMQVGGATALELVSGLLYAVTTVAWAATALTFSRAAAVVTAAVYLVTAPFAVPFHEPSSDMVVAAGLAVFSLGLVRTWRRPTTWRFAALGLGVTALTLARPSYEVLVLAIVLPLALFSSWRVRAVRTGAFLAAVVVPLALWAVHNGIRYGETTVSRSGSLNVPFYPAYLAREVDPGAGPASRRLARLVQRQVLALPAYHRLGVDVETYFHSGRNYEVVRLAGLVDRIDGLGSDYALLRDVAREADVPGDVLVRGVNVSRSARTFRGWLGRLAGFEFRTKPDAWKQPAQTVDVDGRAFPNPAAQPPAPDAVPYGFLACASDEIARCVLRDPISVYHDAALARRYGEITRTVARWDEGLGAREPNAWLAARLDSARRVLPPTWVWLVLALVGLVVRRPRGTLALGLLTGLALALLAVHALGGRPDPLYALPVLPAIVVAAICALAAPRVARRDGDLA